MPTIALIVGVFSMGGGAATLAGLPFAAGSPRPDQPDPFFPSAGNSGYDVDSYDVALDYAPGANRLEGRVTMDATATEDLHSFFVDMRPNLRVSAASVAGIPAETEQRGEQNLEVVPKAGIAEGESFELVLGYAGRPGRRAASGWIKTSDGAVALNEPRGVPSWMPVNDDVRDKALWDFELTVPRELKAVANGRYAGRERDGAESTYLWRGDEPMSSYLAVVAIGRYRLEIQDVDGIPAWVATDTKLLRQGREVAPLAPIHRFFAKRFGPYPFSSTGAILDRIPASYALETQTRSTFEGKAGSSLLAHELAHQWFGDSVSLSQWPDIWLNEGFAQWAQWLWGQRQGSESLLHRLRRFCGAPASRDVLWRPPPAYPGRPERLFATSIYARGGLTLEALRQQIGGRTFTTVLRRWATENRYGSVRLREFEDLAEQVSGEQLDRFFDDWLRDPAKPRDCARYSR